MNISEAETNIGNKIIHNKVLLAVKFAINILLYTLALHPNLQDYLPN